MSPIAVVSIAFVVGLAAMSFAFAGGGVIIAIPLAIVGIGVIALIDITRRRRQAQQVHDFREEAKTKDVDFTERDKETLVSE